MVKALKVQEAETYKKKVKRNVSKRFIIKFWLHKQKTIHTRVDKSKKPKSTKKSEKKR